MSIFAQPPAGGRGGLFEMQCGKATLAGTTVTADPRKGILSLKKSEDGLMHLIWKDRTTNAVEEDLIVFPGDATLRHLDVCKDGYVMLLEFTQTKRKLFFWSHETLSLTLITLALTLTRSGARRGWTSRSRRT